MWAYFTLKLGWLKTSAGTNMEPKNDMYLSAPGYRLTDLQLDAVRRHNLLHSGLQGEFLT